MSTDPAEPERQQVEDCIRLFWEGDRATLARLYRLHFQTMSRAAAVLTVQADREGVIQDVFFRLISDEGLRTAYRGPDMGVWLYAIVRNQSLDHLRRLRREIPQEPTLATSAADWASEVDARLLVDRFRREVMPRKWAAVFEARFIRQLSQLEAAASLKIARTTLAYQERRLRKLLRRFLLG